MGSSGGRLAAILTAEVAGVLVSGVALAGLLAALLWRLGDEAVRVLVRLSRGR